MKLELLICVGVHAIANCMTRENIYVHFSERNMLLLKKINWLVDKSFSSCTDETVSRKMIYGIYGLNANKITFSYLAVFVYIFKINVRSFS